MTAKFRVLKAITPPHLCKPLTTREKYRRRKIRQEFDAHIASISPPANKGGRPPIYCRRAKTFALRWKREGKTIPAILAKLRKQFPNATLPLTSDDCRRWLNR